MADDTPTLKRQIRVQRLVIVLLAVIVVALVIPWPPLPRLTRQTAQAVLGAESPTTQTLPATETETAQALPAAETETAVTYLPMVEQPPERFLATFDGSPSAVQPWHPSDWDVAVHARDGVETKWRSLPPMPASHSADCGAPPTTHQITAYEDTVFLCKDHVMTAINAGGYGLIYLTPNRMADFSRGETVISFDVSTLRTSPRDWIDLWITPYEDNLALPLQEWLPDLQGEPKHAVHVSMNSFNGGTVFKASVVRDFAVQEVAGNWWDTYEKVLTPDAKRRDTFELHISRTHLKFGMPQYNLWWVDSDIEDLGWDVGVVQLGHHTYTPTKDCTSCGPNTWHWDNLLIDSAQPFTIVRGQQRLVDETSSPTVTFARPAPAGAHLRFAAFGATIEVSFDGGVSWQAAQQQAQKKNDERHARSYWTPIPEGTASVQIRGQAIPNYGWHAQDFAIWAR